MMDKEHSKIIVPQTFVKELRQAMDSCAYVYISAHTGWGKTSVIETLLEKTPHTYISLWDQDALKQATGDTTGLVVLDDFQAIYDCKEGETAIVELASVQLKTQSGKHTCLELADMVLSTRLVCTQRDYPLAYSIASSFQQKIKEHGPVEFCPTQMLCYAEYLYWETMFMRTHGIRSRPWRAWRYLSRIVISA